MRTTFANIARHEIKYDCRFYNGYKPCGKHDGCPDCPHYAPRGEQVLVIKLGAMGDVLRTKSILPSLKRAHPESWICWLTAPGSEAIVRDPLVDEIRTLTPEGVLALEGRPWARIVCLDKDAHAVALSARLPAGIRQGFAPTAYNTVGVWNDASMEALRLGLSDEFKFRINQKSVPQILHDIIEAEYLGDRFRLAISEKQRHDARAKLDSLAVPRSRRIIGLNTGCGPVFATKGWTVEGFIDLIRLLTRTGQDSILLLGGAREAAIHTRIMETFPELAGRVLFDSGNANSLEMFFALVQECDLVVTSDSLCLHVAVATDRKVVSFFGPTCAQEIDLYGLGEKIVTDFECSPCYLKVCPHDVSCMQSLRAETVAASIARVLDGSVA